MVLHALEMEEEEEDEETESLLCEVNGRSSSFQRSNSAMSESQPSGSVRSTAGHGNGTSNGTNGTHKPNGMSPVKKTTTTTTTSSSSRIPSKMALIVFALASVGALVLLFIMSGENGGEELLKPMDEVEEQTATAVAHHEPTPTTTTATTAATTTTNQEAFVYSNIAKIIPDPDHNPIDTDTQTQLAQKYGKWHFWDGDEAQRPTNDYCAPYPHRDIPGDEFPDTAWQVDAVFVNHFLNDAEQLVSRAMEAIFEEYGHGKPLPPEGLAERRKMFHWYKIAIMGETGQEHKVGVPTEFTKHGDKGVGGWTTERSFDGLVKRLLHAMMTNDTFTVVLGGHSAAAGHGNHFRQSYMMQFHKIMAPIFARLGVKLVTRNLSQGGLGTLHNSIGMAALYGEEIDLILWDSGMTETKGEHVDLFYRQALLSGNRVPVIWGGGSIILAMLHQMADADIGTWGTGLAGVPMTTSAEQAQTLPYAARFLQCSHEQHDVCTSEPEYCTQCWIDRDDLNPHELFDKIDKAPGGQVKWHPGWRRHQLMGRVLAFAVLDALQVAIEIWSDGTMGGPPLDDDWWHVTDYYNNIRTKVMNLSPEMGQCTKIAPLLPERLCHTKMQARSLFTPRINPALTSLSTLFRPAPNGYVPHNEEKEMYQGPDVHNSCFDLPPDAVDVLAIVSGRRRRQLAELDGDAKDSSHRGWEEEQTFYHRPTGQSTTNVTLKSLTEAEKIASRRIKSEEEIVMGQGWQVVDEKVGECDGTYDAVCGRERSNPCPLIGHHDSRGSVVGNEYAGWLVMDLPNVKEGLILLKIMTYADEKLNTRTAGWTTVNNERRLDSKNAEPVEEETQEHGRRRTNADGLPDDFFFDYAIDGKITSLNKEQFNRFVRQPQRVVQLITLLDDPNFTTNARNVEVAIRMRNCGRQCTFAISHAYWA